jgi:large subunit ribosomal protein L13
MQQHTIDATDKPLGRVASQVALLLRGKDNPSFLPHVKPTAKVTITNANLIKVTGNKKEDKNYTHYTGYPGGLRNTKMSEIITKKGIEEVIRKAVYGMLPTNKLRPIMMKNLTISE